MTQRHKNWSLGLGHSLVIGHWSFVICKHLWSFIGHWSLVIGHFIRDKSRKLDKLELLKVSLSALLAFILTFSPILPSFKLEHFQLLGALTSEASYITWTNAAGNNRWSDPANWSEGVVPGADDIATFNGTSSDNVLVENDVSIAGLYIDKDYDGIVALSSTQRITIGTEGLTQKGGTFDGGQTPMIVYGSVKVMAGNFTAPKQDLEIKQHLAVFTDQFDANTGTVYFTGGDQVITGSFTLNNFVKQVDSYHSFQLQSGSLISFQGMITLAGTPTAPLDLRSSDTGQPASINVQGDSAVSYVDIKDIINIGNTIACPDTCLDSGNNTGWTLPSPASTENGTLTDQTQGIITQINKLFESASPQPAIPDPDNTTVPDLTTPEPSSPGLENYPEPSAPAPAQPSSNISKTTVNFSGDENIAFTVNIQPLAKQVVLDPITSQDSVISDVPAKNIQPAPTPLAPSSLPSATPSNKQPLSGLFETKIGQVLSRSVASTINFFALPVTHAAANDDSASDEDLQPAEPSDVRARIIDPAGQPLITSPVITTINNATVITMPEPGNSIRPGKYQLEVTVNMAGQDVTETQDFTWGVLAMNLDQSTYAINDEVAIGIGVLDDGGRTLCDSNLTLDITGQDNNGLGIGHWALGIGDGISRSPNCGPTTVTNNPDYSAVFSPTQAGEYTLHLQAETDNGIRTMDRSFQVTPRAPFTTSRSTATRIFPLADYTNSITITAAEDFQGDIYEPIPGDFKIKGISAPGTVIFTDPGQKPYIPAGIGGPVDPAADVGAGKTPSETIYPPDKGGEEGLENNNTPVVKKAPSPQSANVTSPDANAKVPTVAGTVAPSPIPQLTDQPSPSPNQTPAATPSPSVSPAVDTGAAKTPGVKEAPPSPSPSPDPDELLKLLDEIKTTLSRDNPDTDTAFSLEPLNPAIYDQQLANQDQYIVWRDVSIKASESVTLTYVYDAPDKSPEFYLLGPLALTRSNEVNTPDVLAGTDSSGVEAGNVGESSAEADTTSLDISEDQILWSEPHAWQLAADAVFNSAASGNWNIGTTWGGACSSSCTAGIDFPDTTDTAVIASGHTVTLDSARTVNTLTVNSGGTFDPGAHLLTETTLDVTGTIKVGASTFAGSYSATPTLNAGSTVDYSLAGTQTVLNTLSYVNLTISGSGTKTLGGATAITGDLTVTSTLADGGNAITLSGASNTIYGLTGGGTISAAVTLGANYTINVASNTLTVSGIISGAYNLAKSGAGTVSLTGANTYTGTTTISEGTISANKIVVASSNSSLGNASSAVVLGGEATSGTLSSTQGTISYTRGFTVNAGGGEIDNSTGTLTIATGGITANGPLSLGRTGTITISAIIADGATAGSLIKIGTTTLTLTGANTFTGGLTIKAGMVFGGTSTSAFGGSGTGAITIGDTSGSASATLSANNNLIYANPITVASGSSGTLSISSNGYTHFTLSGAITLNNNLTISDPGGSILYITGGITGTGNLTLNSNANDYYGVDLRTTAINNIGTITNSGTGNRTTTISAVIGTNVTGVIQNSATSQLTLSGNNSSYAGGVTISAGTVLLSTSANAAGTGTITLGDSAGGSNAATLLVATNSLTYANAIALASSTTGTLTVGNTGTAISTTFSGGVTGTNNLTINENATSGTITFAAGTLNHTGTITNTGAGTGTTTISAVIGTNVTGVIQNSATSQLTLSGNNSSYAGGVQIKSGVLRLLTSANAAGTGTIIIGDSSGSANALLRGSALTFANLISVGTASGSSSGDLKISDNGSYDSFTLSGAITLYTNLTIQPSGGSTITISGGITGTGNVSTSNTSGLVNLYTTPINHTGTITHTGAGTGTTTISAVIGTNVTGITQNSATSALTLSGNNSTVGSVTISAGTLILSGSTNLNVSGSWTNSVGAGGFTANTSTVTLTTGTHAITGANTFYNLTINANNAVTFPASTTQTISNTFSCTGTAGNVITIDSSSSGTQATLSKASGTVSCDYLSLKDSAATGGAEWHAGANSTQVSGVTGWLDLGAVFIAAASGNWNIGTTWGGACASSCAEGGDYPTTTSSVSITNYKISLTGTAGADDLTISTNAVLDLAGNDLTVNNSFTLNPEGTLILQGSETISPIDTNNGTVMYNGTGQYSGLKAGDSYNDLVINNGLVGYWKFDDGTGTTVADSSGYGNDGTLTYSGGDEWVSGTPYTNFTNPYSLDFDGTNDYVQITNTSALNPSYITISAWIKSDNLTTLDDFVMKWPGGNGPGYALLSGVGDATKLRFIYGNGTSYSTIESTAGALSSNAWYHVVATMDGSREKVYVNGVLVGDEVTSIASITSGTTDVIIGGAQGGGGLHNGRIDDVRVYSHALTEQEVNTLATGSISPTGTGLQLLDANLDVNGDLIINDGELDVSSSNYTITVAGSFENNGGAFTPRSSTVTLDGTSGSHELQSGGQAFNNLAISPNIPSTADWTLHDDLDVDGTFSQAGSTLSTNSTDNWTIHAADFDQTAGTFTPNTSTVTIDSASNQTIQAASSLYNLQVEDPTETNLVGYWKFDEGQGTTAADSSGSGHTGTLTGSPKWTTTVTSTISYDNPYSLDFDGVDDYVSLSNETATPIESTGTATAAGWVYYNGNGNYPKIVFLKGENINSMALFLGGYSIDRQPQFRLRQSDGTIIAPRYATAIPIGEWHHIAATADGSQIKIYVDGDQKSLSGTSTYDGTISGNPSAAQSSIGYSHNGQIDDVRIYNAALTAPEIANLANGYYANGDSGTATFTLNANLDINNSLTFQSGILDVSATPYNITLAKDWNNYGGASSFTDQTGTVTLDGANQTIRGTTTFYDLTDQESSTDTLTFETGKTQTIAHTLNFDGAISNLLSLRSSVPSTRYTLDVTTAQTLTYVNVQDSNASTSNITCLTDTCVNSGNNDDTEDAPHWAFLASFQAAVSGFWNIGTTWGGACSGSCTEGTDYPSSINTVTIPTYKVTLTGTAAASNLSISSGGSLNLSGYDLTVANNFVLNPEGTLIAQGSETIPAIDTNNGTVMYNGTGQYSGLKAGDSYNDLIINNGLVGYWKFDDGTGTTMAKDSSGYGNDGTLTLMDSATDWVTGTPYLQYTNPYSLDFDGTDDYVDAGTASNLDLTNAVTISAWVKSDDTTSIDRRIIQKSNPSAADPYIQYGLQTLQTTGKVRFQLDIGGTLRGLDSTNALPANGWHHVVGTYDGTNRYIYIDGVQDASSSLYTGNIGSHVTWPLYIGKVAYSAINNFDGLIDDVRVYNHALTEQEINSLAAGSISPTGTGKQLLDANLDVNGDLIINDGELDVSSSNYTITVAGSFENNGGAFNPRSSTVTLDGTSGSHELQIGGQAFNNLTISGSGGTWTQNDNLDVNGTYTQSNGTVDANTTDNWSIHAADFDQTAGAFTPRAGTVVVNSASNQTIQAASSLYNLQVEDPTETGLVGYWKFDEGQGTTAADSSGNGNTGTLTNAPKWSTTVTSTITYDNPYSLDFDGTGDYVTVTDSASLDSVTGAGQPRTWAYWILYNGGANDCITDKSGFEGNSLWSESQSTYIQGGVTTTGPVQTPTLTNGQWYHIAFTYDGANTSLYLNGNLVDGPQAQTAPADNNNALQIGGTSVGSTYTLNNGNLDDLRIYSAALTAPEIANLADGYYANGDSGTATFTLNANLDVNNSLTLQSGILDVGNSINSYNITLAKDWNNYGGASSFTDEAGTVTLDGTSQTIRGTTTFYDLTDQETSSDTLTFQTSTTQTIAGTLNFDGAISNLLSLRSSVPSTRYTLDVTSPQTLTYVNAQDSNASTSNITCLTTTCVDAGNNDEDETTPFWVFTEAATRGRIMIISLLHPSHLYTPGV